MYFYSNERIALFIDGPNLLATCKVLGFDIDFRRLLGFFQKQGQLVRALYYTPITGDEDYRPIRPLIDWLEYNGFTVVTKPAKEFEDAAGRRKIKGSTHVELAVDAMTLARHLDHLVIVSGDSDFCPLVLALQGLGKRVSVISTLQCHPTMIADALRRQVDHFIDLADLDELIGKPKRSAG